MKITVGGKEVETTSEGFLVNADEWTEQVAEYLAREEGLELSERHWDVIRYLRKEYFDNHGNQPNNRQMNKAMGDVWGEKVDSKRLFELFPGNPSKQAGRLAGLPESRRKGGY